MSRKQFICVVISIIFILNILIPNNTEGALIFTGKKIDDVEQKLIEEILALDSKVLSLQNQLDELSSQNKELEKSLQQKKRELMALDNKFKDNQHQLADWIVFSFKGGLGNFLTVLVGADDLGEFFRRFDNILFIMEYYNNVILETKSVISIRRQEELDIVDKQKQIKALEEQAQKALEEIKNTLEKKQNELNQAKLVLDDTAFLEMMSKSWQEALPSLDYLLKNLSKLPWSNVSPDDLKVNYFSLTARAEFTDKSLTKKLFSGDERLKYVYFTFSPEGVTVSEKLPGAKTPFYSITCNMILTKDQKVRFKPVKLDFSGVKLPPKVIEDFMASYDMTFTPPPLPLDLKVSSIATTNGKLIIDFKK